MNRLKRKYKKLKWRYRELQRLYRLVNPEASARMLIRTVGRTWLLFHGARREYKVKLWKTGPGWYAIDLVIPKKKLGVEAKGGWRHYYRGDVARDQALISKGWQILRITEKEMSEDPKGSRKRLRRFLR